MTTPALQQSNQNDTPAYVSPSYVEMVPRWQVCRDMRGGTDALRGERAEDYLPKAPAETDEEHARRLKRTELFPMFSDTIDGLAGIVFHKAPELGADVPAQIKEHWENIDGAGTHGDVFCREVFEDALEVGHAIILVDFPQAPLPVGEDGKDRALTLAEEKALGLRPYWIHIHAEQILSWLTDVIRGQVVLRQLVIRETLTVPDGRFKVKDVTQYRIFVREENEEDPNTPIIHWETWIHEDGNDPQPQGSGIVRNVPAIPIAVVYGGNRLAPLKSTPPLLDLAYTNIAHAQVLSDHRHSLHIASSPILVFKGRPILPVNTSGEPEQVIGPNTGVDVSSDGDVKYVEHQGTALNATRQEIQDLEKRGAAQGLAMLQSDTRAAETAEARRIEKAQKEASLSSAARSLQDAIEVALNFHAAYLGLDSGGSMELDRDFEVEPMDAATIQTYSNMVAAGQLSLRTMWQILQKHKRLPETLDLDAEEKAIEPVVAIANEDVDDLNEDDELPLDDPTDQESGA